MHWVQNRDSGQATATTGLTDVESATVGTESTEINLALALENYSEDIDVDFTTIWGLGHTEAERSGDSTSNFISWVNECFAGQ